MTVVLFNERQSKRRRLRGECKACINNNFSIYEQSIRNVRGVKNFIGRPGARSFFADTFLPRGEKLLHVSTVCTELIDIPHRRDHHVLTLPHIVHQTRQFT